MLLFCIKQKSKLSKKVSHTKRKVSSGLITRGMSTIMDNGKELEFKSSKTVTSTIASIMKVKSKEFVCKF
jgi:hypothetical protein